MVHYPEKLLAGILSLLLLDASLILAQRVLQDRVPDAPAVQQEEAERDDVLRAERATLSMAATEVHT